MVILFKMILIEINVCIEERACPCFHFTVQSQQFKMYSLDQPQRAFAVRIDGNLHILESAVNRLSERLEATNLGHDAVRCIK